MSKDQRTLEELRKANAKNLTKIREEYDERLNKANHLLCQIVIASASGFLGDPAKRKTEVIVKAAEHLDSTRYWFAKVEGEK